MTIDSGISVTIPARPDLDGSTVTETRVWNTIARFDHQVTPSNTWGIRWLREYSPQFNQIIDPATDTLAALGNAREEDDLDQTVVATLNSVVGNTRVNTLRFGWDAGGRDLRQRVLQWQWPEPGGLPSDADLSDIRGSAERGCSGARQRRLPARRHDVVVLPGKHGDHDLKFGLQFQYRQSENDTQDNSNGTFTFGQSNAAFDQANPRTYPDRFSIRVPGPGGSLNKSQYYAGFLQDKWKLNDRLTLSLGLRYDVEVIPIRETDNPLFASPDDYPVDKNNFQPRLGFAYGMDEGKGVLRGGYGRFYDKTHFELIGGIYTGTPFATSFVQSFPLQQADQGPRTGAFPTDPFLVNGPVITDAMRAELARMLPPGRPAGIPAPPGTALTAPAEHRPVLILGYEHQLGPNFWRPQTMSGPSPVRLADLEEPQSADPQQHDSGGVNADQGRQRKLLNATDRRAAGDLPAICTPSTDVTIPVNAARTDYDALLVSL